MAYRLEVGTHPDVRRPAHPYLLDVAAEVNATEEEEMHKLQTSRAVAACLAVVGLTMASCSGAGSAGTVPARPVSTATDFPQSTDATRPQDADAVSVVTAALRAWSEGDRPAFDALLADDAYWFGQPLDTEVGRRQFEFQWGYNTTLGATFADLECADSGRAETVSTGILVACSGSFGDTRSEMMGTNPAAFEAEYAVDAGRIVEAVSFRTAMDEEASAALDFIDTYLTGLGGEYGRACNPAGSSGARCAEFILSHLPTVVEAWSEEPVS